jgi:alpha-galactosidase
MLSSMQGSLGIGDNLNKWTSEDFATAKRLISAYHDAQKTITQGDLYRLVSPRDDSEFSSTQTVSPDKSQSVVFAFTVATKYGKLFPLLQLQGLDQSAKYKFTAIEGKPLPGFPESASGDWWMHHGINLELKGDYQASMFRLDREP